MPSRGHIFSSSKSGSSLPKTSISSQSEKSNSFPEKSSQSGKCPYCNKAAFSSGSCKSNPEHIFFRPSDLLSGKLHVVKEPTVSLDNGHSSNEERLPSETEIPVLRLPNITSKLVLLVLNCWRGKIKKFSLDNRTCPLTFCSQKYEPVSCTTQYKLRYSAVRDIFLPRKPVRPPTSHQLKGNIEMAWYR